RRHGRHDPRRVDGRTVALRHVRGRRSEDRGHDGGDDQAADHQDRRRRRGALRERLLLSGFEGRRERGGQSVDRLHAVDRALVRDARAERRGLAEGDRYPHMGNAPRTAERRPGGATRSVHRQADLRRAAHVEPRRVRTRRARGGAPCERAGGSRVVARRTRLRTRVLLLTVAFAIALFAITFGLSWRAQVAQERWSRLVGVETRATAVLEELIRAQNAYRRSAAAPRSAAEPAAGPPAARWRDSTTAAEPAAVQ